MTKTKQPMDEKLQELEKLKRENELLRKNNDELMEQKKALEKELNKTKKEFEEYKARHPHTTGVKNGKPYVLSTPVRSEDRKKPGARKGHKRQVRPMPQQVDNVVEVPVTCCAHCGNTNIQLGKTKRSRTVEDIIIIQPTATRFDIQRGYCPACKRITEGKVTAALPRARIGIKVMLTVTWLKVHLRMTEEAIPELMMNLFNFKISEGEVIQILNQVAKVFGPYYDELTESIRNAPARYMDDTSWTIDGEKANLWAFITKGEALFVMASSRSHEVPLAVLGSNPKGADIHDRHSSFRTLERKTGRRPQQDCWAHIICDAKELAQFYGDDGKVILEILKKTYADAKKVEHIGTEEDVERLKQYLTRNLDRQYSSRRCRRFAANLFKGINRLFVFVTNPDVDPTNNAAERALRHSVIARKISGGSRSRKGAQTYQVLQSVCQTLIKRGKSLLTHGKEIINSSLD